ncbi:MAG: carboxylating nicotinate-nucleotide diphosphorylase [Bdellovibrionales bacterium]
MDLESSQSILPDVMLEPVVRAALLEDLGRCGDITSMAVIPQDATWAGAVVARQSGVIAGMDCARLAFALLDRGIRFSAYFGDGQKVAAGDRLAALQGPARGILSAERVALNFLGHLSGIATATHALVEAVKPFKTRVCCTRKTTPGLRALEKLAVKAGGGFNHRFGLDDAILIKDNHIAVAGGISQAVTKARAAIGHMVKIELEVDTLEQLKEALTLPVDAVLLDNMTPGVLAEAVALVNGKFPMEASGGVTLATIKAIAASGVDYISAGSITHSAPALDVALDEG